MLAICLATAAVYWAGLSGSFMFDDYPNIVDNAALREFRGDWSNLFSAANEGRAGPLGRPLSLASFALNLHYFGLVPFYFKLVNLLIHLANGLLVFALARQLLSTVRAERLGRTAHVPFWIAALWLLHPINLSTVLFSVQRMTGLAALFTLLGLYLYLYGRTSLQTPKGKWAITASLLVCWPAAVLSKETGLLLPIYILLCEWLVLRRFRQLPASIKWKLALLVLGASSGFLFWQWEYLTYGYLNRDFSVQERLMTEARVLWFYVQQMLVPWPQHFGLYHDDIPISKGLLSPISTLAAILGWIAIALAALLLRRKFALFSFAVLWFLVSHVLESTLLPLEIAFEHRNYLASFGLFVWLGHLLFPEPPRESGRAVRWTLALGFLLFCGFITTLRSSQWSDEYRRTQLEVAYHPNSARSHYDAAVMIVRKTFSSGNGNALAYQMAKYHYMQAEQLSQHNIAPLLGLLNLDCALGLPKNLEYQARLRERFATARFYTENQSAINRLPALLIEGQLCLDPVEVKALIEAGLANPDAKGHWRAVLYAVAMDYAAAKLKLLPVALAYARAAVDTDPNYVAFRINLIHLLLATQNHAEASEAYQALRKMKISAYDKAGMQKLESYFNHLERREPKQP